MAYLEQDKKNSTTSKDSYNTSPMEKEKENENMNLTDEQIAAQNGNLNKSSQLCPNDIRINKINMNSSNNNPTANTATNQSMNDQLLVQKKDHSDELGNEILYQDEEDNEQFFKEYTIINDRRIKVIEDSENINERIKNNKNKIEELKNELKNLKEEKKQKQSDIVNLLSNKESLEEIYKNQIYFLNNLQNNGSNSINENKSLISDVNTLANLCLKNEINDNSTIHLNSIHNIVLDNDFLNFDEDNFKISLIEIKEAEQQKYIEQVTNMFEDIFQKKDEKLNSLIGNIINNSFEIFINNNNEEKMKNEKDSNEIINNFFGKISLFISNHSLGKFPENKINLFLRYLLKINIINAKLTKYIKFVSKKYKEKKKEINDMINFLEKKNISLTEKNNRLENNVKKYEEKLEYLKNDDFDPLVVEDGILGPISARKFSSTQQRKMNNKTQNNNKDGDNDEQMNNKVVIEYEDGIDQNAEINYEDDGFDYEKNNEMIKQGLNPYKNDENKLNKKQHTEKFNDSEKFLIEMIKKKKKVENNFGNDNKEEQIKKNKNGNSSSEDDNKRDLMAIQGKDIQEDIGKKNSNNLLSDNVENNKNNNEKDKNVENDLKNQNKEEEPQIAKKISNTSDNKSINININLNNKFLNENEPVDQTVNKELEHYMRVQKIMSAGPKVNNIFGVNNYNPENNSYAINLDKSPIFSGKKNTSECPSSSNKIEKIIRIGSRQNHNFVSVINMTKTVPQTKKKSGRERLKDKNKKDDDNEEGTIKVINLQDDFSKEKEKDEDQIENGKEKTEQIEKENIPSNNENLEKKDKEKDKNQSNSGNKNQNENQEKVINIAISKESEKEAKNTQNNENIKIKDNNLKTKTENSNNEFFNSDKKRLKITKSRELNIKELKNNKMLMMGTNNALKGSGSKHAGKAKAKLVYLTTTENKDAFPLDNTGVRPKINYSFNKKTSNPKKLLNKSNSNDNSSSQNIKEISGKRSYSISDNSTDVNAENKNNNSKRGRVSYSNTNMPDIISSNLVKNKKILSIPKTNNLFYNSKTNDIRLRRRRIKLGDNNYNINTSENNKQ